MAADAKTPGRHRVLLVDDHPLVREWVAGLISRESDLMICGHAEDAQAALAAAATTHPDLVVIDLSLNQSSGMVLIKDMRLQFPAIQILVLSMHAESSVAERALRAGARGYILKKESTTRVIEGIRAVLAGQIYLSPSLMSALAGRLLGSASRADGTPGDVLSDQEMEVFLLRGEGRVTKEIGRHLQVSVRTVESYESRIKEKLGLATAGELVREAVRWHDRKHDL